MKETAAGEALLIPERLDLFLEDVIEEGQPTARRNGEALVSRAVEAWRAAGLQPGDLVLIGLSNSRAMLGHLFAVLALRAVPAVIPASTPSSRLSLLARAFGARAIGLQRLPPLDPSDLEGIGVLEGPVEVAWLPAPSRPAAAPGETVLLTSGTSGLVSGCVHDTAALLRNAEKHATAIGLCSGDVVLVTLPLHYSYALVAQALAALVRSTRLVLSAPPFRPPRYRHIVKAYDVTVSSLTPVLFQAVLAEDAAVDPVLRVLTVGGDALPPDGAARWQARHPRGELYATYGLTEAGPRVATLALHAEPASRWPSVGLPLPGTRLVLGEGDELLVSSDTLMKRRIGDVEGRKVHEWRADGLLATGDVGSIDADGYLYLRGRLSEFALIGGEKVFLGSIRRLVGALPGVVRAETLIVRDEGGDAYDLVVHVQPHIEPQVLQAKLTKLLRPAERPRAMRAVRSDAPPAFVYK